MSDRFEVEITNLPFIEMIEKYSHKWDIAYSHVFDMMLGLIVCGFEFDSQLFENRLNSECASYELKASGKSKPF